MYEAWELPSGKVHRFRTVSALARRLGGKGAETRVEHDSEFAPPRRRVMILRGDRSSGGYHVITTVSVPSEALPS